jgi:hypothetical protein
MPVGFAIRRISVTVDILAASSDPLEGASVSREIPCPHCQRKLSVRDELVGKRLACPQCKGEFQVPAEEPADAAGGPDLGFLDSLSTSPAAAARPAAGSSAAGPQKPKKQPAQKPAAKQRSPAGRPSPWAGVAANLKAVPRRAWYIGGGAAVAILLIIIVVMVIGGPSGGKRSAGGKKRKPGPVLYGLSEVKRQHIFEELVRSIDQAGEEKAKKNEWPKIAAAYKLDSGILEKIVEEGLDNSDWLLPATENYTIQTKTNRVEWLKKHNTKQISAATGRR